MSSEQSAISTPAPIEAAPAHHGGHWKILLGLAIGITLGLVANAIGFPTWNKDEPEVSLLSNSVGYVVYWAEPVGKIFLRMMQMVVLPLVFSALSLAIVEVGSVQQLGRMGLRTLFYTALLSFTAVLIGIGLVNAIHPGKGLSDDQRKLLMSRDAAKANESIEKAKQAKSLRETLVDLLPENPVQEMYGAIDGNSKGTGMLAVMVFALFFGIAMTHNRDACRGLIEVLEGLNAVSMTIIGFAMKLAPAGAGCLVFVVTAKMGLSVLQPLFWFVVTVILGLALHLFGTYSLVLVLFGKQSPWVFFQAVSDAMLMAFGTSSSSATLPTALRVADEELKIPSRVSNFVLTVGATGNQNGTALFEGVVILFLAQVLGVELSMAQQLQVVLMSILAGVGTAGVPGGSIPLIVVVMQSVGLDGHSISIIIGVDRLLDMCRTVVNVTGDLVITACVARGEADAPHRQVEISQGSGS